MGYSIGLAASHEIRVNGTRIGEDVRRLVGRVQVEMDVDRADALTISLQPVSDTSTARLLDSYLFAEGNVVEACVRYEAGPLVSLGIFDLQPAAGRGGRGGIVTTVRGLSPSHRMLDNRLPRIYGADYPDSDIAAALATEYGFVADTTSTLARAFARTKEAGVSDFALMNFLAAEAKNSAGEAYCWRTEWDPAQLAGRGAVVLRYGPIQLRAASTRMRFRAERWLDLPATIYSWSVDPSIKGIPTKISLVWTDTATREEREVVVELANPDSDPVVVWSGFAARVAPKKDEKGKTPENAVHKATEAIDREVQDGSALRFHASGTTPWGAAADFSSEQEAVAWARSLFRWLQVGLCEGEFEVPGVPELRPWQVHDFVGMSSRWDGSYLLTSVTHTLDPKDGYQCQLHGRKLPGLSTEPAAAVRA